MNRITEATILRVDLKREGRTTCEEAITVMQMNDDVAWTRVTEAEMYEEWSVPKFILKVELIKLASGLDVKYKENDEKFSQVFWQLHAKPSGHSLT